MLYKDAIQAKDQECEEHEEVQAAQYEAMYMIKPCGGFLYRPR